MLRSPIRRAAAAALSLAAAASPVPALSQGAKLVAGTLTCQGGGGVGLVLGSKKTYTCSFNPASQRPNESYTATVTKLGLDIGVTGPTVMVWTVLATTADLPSGALVGNYGGLAADASVGVGAGAKVLVGGNKSSITLQPLSVQGQTGVNLALGVAGLALTRN